MTLWSFEQVAAMTAGRWLRAPGPGDRPPVGAALDTRELSPGMLFAAFRGERADGHAHIAQGASRGASMALATDAGAVPPGVAVPVLLVPDAAAALTELARFWRNAVAGLRVVGVTGSNGKTTTCRLLHGAVGGGGGGGGGLRCSVSARSFNNRLGVPITLLNARPDDEVVVCEIGMSTPGEISARCALARPDAAVITNVGEAHLAGLGSVGAVAREKASIALGLPPGGVVVIPDDQPALEGAIAADAPGARIVRVGAGRAADHRLGGVDPSFERTRFTVDGVPFEVPLPGAHNAMNGALAVAAARWLGVDDAAIARGLAAATPAPMRLERRTIATSPPITVINDAYNANPGSVRAALAVLCAHPAPGRRVAVLGDMLELGPIADRAHRAVLECALELGVDAVLTLGPLFAGTGWATAEPDAGDDAIERVAGMIRPGDTVLVKGSRGLRLERLVDRIGRLAPAHAPARAVGPSS